MFNQNHDKNDNEHCLNILDKTLPYSRVYDITATCKYDAMNHLIIDLCEEYELTKRENVFINLLIKKRRIITYSEMKNIISGNYDEFSINAIRVFVKNFRKKLPGKVLKNVPGVGYKLTLNSCNI